MRKLYKLLLIVMLLFIASCGGMEASYGGHPNIDGITFDYLTSFSYNNTEYQISFPSSGDEAAFYLYEETEYKTEVENWTINYYYDTKYIYDQYFNEDDEIFVSIYNALVAKLDVIEEKLGHKIENYTPEALNEIEVSLENVFDSEIICVFVDKYIPIRLKNSFKNYSYTISIPVKRYHVVKNDDRIVNPFNNEIISWEDFLALLNVC